MILPKRIILSRKGFDSSAGGCASPILPDGTMFSVPVPESADHRSSTRYEDLGRQGHASLPPQLITSLNRAVALAGPVHLDPDIRPDLRSSAAQRRCSPKLLLYGQNDGSQTHLTDQGVRQGDLFLFFGWFRQTEWSGKNLQYMRGASDRHVIWGWLEVGRRHSIPWNGPIPNALESARHHPHLDSLNRQTNCVYEAPESLSFNPHLCGAGIFNPYSQELCLTAPQQPLRSHWELPAFFRRTEMTHVPWDKWVTKGDSMYGKSPGRGQEFVFRTEPIKTDIEAWLDGLFQHAEKKS
jgi:hypothetical protein